MSFAEQERALFDLIFNHDLRDAFAAQGIAALSAYDLTAPEQADFGAIRPAALDLDAHMRINLLLGRFCRELPLSFGIASSLSGGFDMLRLLVNSKTMRVAPEQRLVVFAERLRDAFHSLPFANAEERGIAIAIVDTERSMASMAALLKQNVIDGNIPTAADKPDNWEDLPVKFAPYLCANQLPRCYTDLKNLLCPNALDSLWQYLKQHPISPTQRSDILRNSDPRILVARAYISQYSQCAPATSHYTVELAEGFAPLFQHINGHNSIAAILSGFAQAGAPAQMLDGVRSGFAQLWQSGMLMVMPS